MKRGHPRSVREYSSSSLLVTCASVQLLDIPENQNFIFHPKFTDLKDMKTYLNEKLSVIIRDILAACY